MVDMKRHVSLLAGNQRIPKYRHQFRDTLAKKINIQIIAMSASLTGNSYSHTC